MLSNVFGFGIIWFIFNIELDNNAKNISLKYVISDLKKLKNNYFPDYLLLDQ